MESLIIIVLGVVSCLFMGFPDRFGRKRFENWILSRPKPYALNALYFGCLGWTVYSGYKDYKDINGGNFFYETSSVWTYVLLFYLTLLGIKRLEIDKKDKSNRIDYFKNKQEKQKELIEKSK